MRSLLSNLKLIVSACRQKGRRYWFHAVLFAFLGIWASHLLGENDEWRALTNGTYILVQNLRGGQKRVPLTTLVAIEDSDYYGEELAARKPLKRSYLARLISRIAEARPLVIALDVDLRSPNPDAKSPDFGDYTQEDQTLISAVCAASKTTKVVLSAAVNQRPDGNLAAEPNIYDNVSQCQIPNQDIRVGFLSLPADLRRVPLSVTINENLSADSFALAIARAARPHQYPNSIDLQNLPYGEFHDTSDFIRVGAGTVLTTDTREKLHNQIVMVFGEWHILAKNRGASIIDTFRTPVGLAGGAYVHANLAETLIGANLRSAPPEWTPDALDALTAIWLAVMFAFHNSLSQKLLRVVLAALVLLAGAWLFFQIFALFFDILPVLAAMSMHAVVDHVSDWRDLALQHAAPAEVARPQSG